MKEMWNERYSVDEYVYGTEPNSFLKEWLSKLTPGKALFLGEGEGRNAVFAAEQGWDVQAVDYSEAGKAKALKLARERNVKLNFTVADLSEYQIPPDSFDLVVLIFLHLPEKLRSAVHSAAVRSLKNGGCVILEAYDKDQLKFGTGGPKVPELLYSLSDITEDFIQLEFRHFEKKEIEVTEGKLHQGKSSVIRFVGKFNSKPNE